MNTKRYESPSLTELGGFAEQTRGLLYFCDLDIYGLTTYEC